MAYCLAFKRYEAYLVAVYDFCQTDMRVLFVSVAAKIVGSDDRVKHPTKFE